MINIYGVGILIINHNILGLKSLNRLNQNESASETAMEKLSSGLRINSTADDSAGLAISEKMRAQIRGLEQAQDNIQDAISLIQTAEGGLGQIINPNLQRLRELAVQASNGTLTASDRQSIQNEVDQIKGEINGIANDTEFNEIKVLRPPVNETPPTLSSGKADIVFIVDVSGSMGGIIDNVINNLDAFVGKLRDQGTDANIGLVSYSDINVGEPLRKWDFNSNVSDVKANMIELRTNMLGGDDIPESGLEGLKDPAKGAISFPFRGNSSKQFILITDAPVHDNSTGKSMYNIESVAKELSEMDVKLSIVGPIDSATSDQLKRLSAPTGGSYFDIEGDFSEQLSTYADTVIEDSATYLEEDEMPTLHFLVGPNEGNELVVELFDARTPNLGIDAIKVDPWEEAQKAIEKIDLAIQKASSVRSRYGAYQNALGHVLNNAINHEVNLVSAESRIRDADYARTA